LPGGAQELHGATLSASNNKGGNPQRPVVPFSQSADKSPQTSRK